MIRQYRAATGRARNAAEKTADFWTRGTRTATDVVPGLPRVDLVPAVERYFELVQRTVDINRRLAVRCAEAVGTLSGVVREKAESAGDLVREKAEAADNVMLEQAEKAQQTALEQAEKAERAEKTLARQTRQQAEQAAREQAEKAEQAEQAEKALALQARQADREQARRAHKRARERYEGRTKAELSDQLAKRELPKTGNVDELIERLVEADSK
jgi:hypothetical protein